MMNSNGSSIDFCGTLLFKKTDLMYFWISYNLAFII